MPELPEVEHARRSLERWVKGSRIDAVRVADARILDEGVRPTTVIRALEGRKVVAIERRGKWLRIVLDRGRVFSHLGMTGKWVRARAANAKVSGDDALVRFEKVRIDVLVGKSASRRSIRYLDPRLFGRFVVVPGDGADLAVWTSLGPDPLLDGIDVDALLAKLARRRLPIKPTLLDQTVLAGVGNIQATEALFFARVDPRRPASSLSRKEVAAVSRGIMKTIHETIAMQSVGEEISYVEEPNAVNPFTIYGREGTPCPRCKKPLGKMILGGRGTVFCVSCQH